jgi:PAS domain S-box-containing protein
MLDFLRKLFHKGAPHTEGIAPARRLQEEQAARRAPEASALEAKRAQREERRQREQLHVTLASIGDAVIVTDARGLVTFLNPPAQTLTGWTAQEAAGQPLDRIFRIINEETRQPCADPVIKVLQTGRIVGLANHTVLIAKDGTERPIDDSAAPIMDENKSISGVVLVFRDVTERRQLERLQRDLQRQLEKLVQARTAELRGSQERFRLLVEGSKDYAIFMLDPQGFVTSWNPGAQRIKGYTAEDIIGQHFSRFYLPEAVARGWPQHELQVAKAEGRFEDEGWRVRKDGTRFWADVIITALYDDQGQFQGFSKVTRDLTERKEAEERLRRAHDDLEVRVQERTAQLAEINEELCAEINERKTAEARLWDERERFRITLASIGDAVIATDHRGEITFINSVAQALTSMPKDQALGRPLQAVFHIVNENTRQPADDPVARVLATGHISGLANHTVLIANDSTERPIDDSAAPIRDEQGTMTGVVLVFRDVTDRRRAEQTRQQLAAIVESSADAIIGQTLDGIITTWNQGAERLYGYAAAEVLGQSISLLMPPGHKDELGAILERIERGEHIQNSEMIRQRKDGQLFDISVSISPIRNAAGQIVGASGIGRDITAIKRTAEALRESEQRLREADRLKDEFLAMLAHELRNPLAPICNALHIMKQPQAKSAVIEWVRDIAERQAFHMARLLDDLLDVSRISRGRIELRKETVDVASIIHHIVETVRPLTAERRHELTVMVPPEPLLVEADPHRVAQVLTNLLHNAAKYTEPGGHIWLTGQREGTHVVLRVQDTGVGISADLLPRVFDLFVQADRRMDRSQGGVGIGLTLVKRLVELHGGGVSAFSAGAGQGSEFIVRLPALPAQEAPPKAMPDTRPSASSDLPTRRILVVDDHADAAESLAMLLRLAGQDVCVAHDGPAALEAALAFHPDMIFLDIGMPGMDGYEVARQLRQRPDLKEAVLVAVTGYGQNEDRVRSQRAGFDRHLVKPVEPEMLHALLAGAT